MKSSLGGEGSQEEWGETVSIPLEGNEFHTGMGVQVSRESRRLATQAHQKAAHWRLMEPKPPQALQINNGPVGKWQGQEV